MKPHKHDWHLGKIKLEVNPNHLKYRLKIDKWFLPHYYSQVWACSICGAVKELKSKEVVKDGKRKY